MHAWKVQAVQASSALPYAAVEAGASQRLTAWATHHADAKLASAQAIAPTLIE
jgi:hypothetical protein